MKNKKIIVGVAALLMTFSLAACSNDGDNTADNNDGMQSHDGMEMEHSGTSEVPSDLKVAENPTFKVGDKVIIKEGHMEGMEGAEATIVGAYDTIAYSISYTPTDGGAKVEDHKWVIHEEIPDAGEAPLKPGVEVTIDAEHMKGMDGVKAEIDSTEKTTVYMIDFTLTTNGEEVTNHKWVTESELAAK